MDYVFCGGDPTGRNEDILTLTSTCERRVGMPWALEAERRKAIDEYRLISVYDNQTTNGHYSPSDFHTFNMGEVEPEFLELGTVLADGGENFGVSTVRFDQHEELLWMGNEGVRAMGESMQLERFDCLIHIFRVMSPRTTASRCKSTLRFRCTAAKWCVKY